MKVRYILLALVALLAACKGDKKIKKDPTPVPSVQVNTPKFDRDSAYAHIEKQLSFGHRVPGNKEHVACKDWLVAKMKSYGGDVTVQEFKSTFLTRKSVDSYNIITSFNPGATKRIALAAHWDSRLVAEKDETRTKRSKPIMGADDGASGIGVLIELARMISQNPIDVGVDFIFFDAEDQGLEGVDWCLGSKYWSSTPHKPNYSANYGILLDMIGAKDAMFGFEGNSEQYAPQLLGKVWKLANDLGYGEYFKAQRVGTIMDDHFYMNEFAKIPTIDIINRPMKTDHGFGHYHHTHKDNIDIISKRSLKAVGTVVANVLYRENAKVF